MTQTFATRFPTDLTGPDVVMHPPLRAYRVPDPSQVIVAIPVFNEARNIRDCLESLFADPWLRQVPIVVADGGSSDATREIVADVARSHPNIRLIDNPRRLQSAAINIVADSCAGPETEVMVRCDAHATYPAGYVRQVAAALLGRPEAASLATPMDACGETCFQKAVAWIVDTPLGSGGSAHRGGTRSQWVDHGHHAGFRLDWFRKVGGYDENFSHNEDGEYDHRLGQAGGKVWLDADIRLDYRVRGTPGALARQYWNYGRGRARTVLKHRMRPRLRQTVPVLNLIGLVVCLALAPLLPVLLLLPLAYLAVLGLVSLAGALKLRSPCGLWAGVAVGIIHNAWGAGSLRETAARILAGGRG